MLPILLLITGTPTQSYADKVVLSNAGTQFSVASGECITLNGTHTQLQTQNELCHTSRMKGYYPTEWQSGPQCSMTHTSTDFRGVRERAFGSQKLVSYSDPSIPTNPRTHNQWVATDENYDCDNFEVEVKFKYPNGSAKIGIGFRVQKPFNQKPFNLVTNLFGYYAFFNEQNEQVVLARDKLTGADPPWRTAKNFTQGLAKVGDNVTIKVVAQGSKYEIYFNENLAINKTDDTFTNGTISLFASGNQTFYSLYYICKPLPFIEISCAGNGSALKKLYDTEHCTAEGLRSSTNIQDNEHVYGSINFGQCTPDTPTNHTSIAPTINPSDSPTNNPSPVPTSNPIDSPSNADLVTQIKTELASLSGKVRDEINVQVEAAKLKVSGVAAALRDILANLQKP